MDGPGNAFQKLVDLMDVLRGPEGCPWDREQTRETLKPMLIEEAYELLDALDGCDADDLCEELGDVLFQVVFHGRISKEKGEFNIHDVCNRLHEKMVRRHPHVFENQSYKDSQELLRNWEEIKTAEKKASGRTNTRDSLLDGVPEKLPALYAAYQISSKASRVDFDWANLTGLREKFLEEFSELQEALETGEEEKIKEEVGDLLFVTVNIARRLEVDPETALNRTNHKFTRRFKAMERHFATQSRSLKDVAVEEMEAFWQSQE